MLAKPQSIMEATDLGVCTAKRVHPYIDRTYPQIRTIPLLDLAFGRNLALKVFKKDFF